MVYRLKIQSLSVARGAGVSVQVPLKQSLRQDSSSSDFFFFCLEKRSLEKGNGGNKGGRVKS